MSVGHTDKSKIQNHSVHYYNKEATLYSRKLFQKTTRLVKTRIGNL